MPAKIKITIEEALNQRDEARNELERAIYRRDLALDKLYTSILSKKMVWGMKSERRKAQTAQIGH